MKLFSRPYRSCPYLCLSLAVLLAMGAFLALAPPSAAAQASDSAEPSPASPSPSPQHAGPQGYLGVDLADVNVERAQTLKLNEVRGAVITLIDHDAPAGKIGLRVNDVVLKLDGQTIESAEPLRHMLREIPPGRKVSLVVSRDGNLQTLAVKLADRRAMEHEVWNNLSKSNNPLAPGPGMALLPNSGGTARPGKFHLPFFGGNLNVGALLEPLTSQMAEYLGVSNGLMVKQVTRKSLASAAGLKVFDVILKVGPNATATLADWNRALRAGQGKTVLVTILRDNKQQALTLQVEPRHK